LVDVDGSQRGIVSLQEALDVASEAGLDLAEIAPSAQPPVVKILDWGRYRYEQTKQLAKSRKNQKQVEVKQIRLGLKIGEHDLQVTLARGREITRPELGRAILDRVMEQISAVADQEQAPQLSGRDLNMIVGPKKDAKAQNSQGNGQTDQA